MKAELLIKIELPSDSIIFKKIESTDNIQKYKECPYCGQAKLPFKLGVCTECGKQVGSITYVNNAESYAKNWYEYIGKRPKVEKLGIEELMDN